MKKFNNRIVSFLFIYILLIIIAPAQAQNHDELDHDQVNCEQPQLHTETSFSPLQHLWIKQCSFVKDGKKEIELTVEISLLDQNHKMIPLPLVTQFLSEYEKKVTKKCLSKNNSGICGFSKLGQKNLHQIYHKYFLMNSGEKVHLKLNVITSTQKMDNQAGRIIFSWNSKQQKWNHQIEKEKSIFRSKL